jgi:hypothetical protein
MGGAIGDFTIDLLVDSNNLKDISVSGTLK